MPLLLVRPWPACPRYNSLTECNLVQDYDAQRLWARAWSCLGSLGAWRRLHRWTFFKCPFISPGNLDEARSDRRLHHHLSTKSCSSPVHSASSSHMLQTRWANTSFSAASVSLWSRMTPNISCLRRWRSTGSSWSICANRCGLDLEVQTLGLGECLNIWWHLQAQSSGHHIGNSTSSLESRARKLRSWLAGDLRAPQMLDGQEMLTPAADFPLVPGHWQKPDSAAILVMLMLIWPSGAAVLLQMFVP